MGIKPGAFGMPLSRGARLEPGRGKMIQVDENQYTGVGQIYAVGDVAGLFYGSFQTNGGGRWQPGDHRPSASSEGGEEDVWQWAVYAAGLLLDSDFRLFLCQDKAVKPFTVPPGCGFSELNLTQLFERWTIPEIAWAGVNQQEAEAQGLHFGVVQAS